MRQPQTAGSQIALRLACFLFLALLQVCIPLRAQSTRGELAGNVTDSSGAVIVGAKVVAVGIDTGEKSETVTTSSGSYHFPELAIGRYNVTVTAAGFATSTSTGVSITINSTTALNMTLKTGSVTENVTVDASAPTVESQTSDISGTISQQQIEDLPIAVAAGVGGLRSPEAFSFLVPGTTGPGTGTGGNSANGVFFAKISGGQSYGAEVLLDGASITRSENGSSFDETSPSIEALQEFKITTSTPSAEFGRTTAGFESFSTKSGTNDLHGTGFAIIKNAVFDANNWFSNGYKAIDCTPGEPDYLCNFSRPQDSKFDYGGTFGGPVRIPKLYNGKDKSFFFFAWEQYKLQQGGVTQSTVPTTAEVGGDFSGNLGADTGLVNPCTGDPVLQNQIFDPATTRSVTNSAFPGGILCRDPFPGNAVPTARFSAAAKALIAGLPAPNQTATPNPPYGFVNNYSLSSVIPTQNTTLTIRGDQTLGDKNKIFASYSSRDNFHFTQHLTLPTPYNNSGYPQDFETHYLRSGWDWTLSPTLLNHLNVGLNRTNSKNFSANIGATPALSKVAPNFYGNSFPDVCWDALDSYSCWGVGNNGDNIDNGIRANDIVSWQKGRHSFQFGVDWRHQQYSVVDDTIPTINFLHSETDFADVSGTPQLQSGNSLASFLLGDVDNSNQTVYNHNSRWNSHYIAGFFEDDLKFSPNLTLNLGFRYDVDSPRHEAENDTSNFDFTLADPAAGGLPGALEFASTCHCNGAWAKTWYKDFAPRLGFAYVLPGTNGKLVLRGGGALIYGPLQYNDFGGAMAQGYTQNRGVGSNFTGPGTAQGFTPAFQLDSGYSGFSAANFAPSTDPGQLTGAVPGQFNAVGGEVITPGDGRPSMTSNWSLQLQQEVAQDLIFTLGYIGQTAQNLRSGDLTNFNNISPSQFSLGDQLDNSLYNIPEGGTSITGVKAPYPTFVGPLGQALRPYPQYDFIQGDCCLENVGHSSYEAMVASLNRHFRQGFNLQVSYTWSKNETDADSTIPFSYDSFRSQSQNSTDHRAEKAVSIQNTPNQLSISYLYQFPFGKGKKFLNNNRALDLLVGGWEIGGIQRYQSGQPLDVGCASGIPYYQNCIRFSRGPAAISGDFASAAYKQNKNKPSIFNGESWFKPAYRPSGTISKSDPGVPMSDAAFVDENREGITNNGSSWLRKISPSCNCSLDPFVFGSGIPRVTEEFTGPMYKAEDFSLLKNFAITERTRFQLKLEAIDAFNRHRMAFPDVEPGDFTGSTGFGVPTGVSGVDYGPRNLQVTGRFNF